jgi:hypothetical protein
MTLCGGTEGKESGLQFLLARFGSFFVLSLARMASNCFAFCSSDTGVPGFLSAFCALTRAAVFASLLREPGFRITYLIYFCSPVSSSIMPVSLKSL